MDPGTNPKVLERVQIFFHGKDYLSENGCPFYDSYVKVYQSDGQSLARCIHQTQVYSESTSPAYTKSLVIDYYFQKRQTLTFIVYVNNEQFGRLKNIPLIHLIQDSKCLERELIKADGNCVGKLKIVCEKVNIKQERRMLHACLKASEIPSLFGFMCLGGSAKDLFFRLVRNSGGNKKNQIILYESEVITNEEITQWQPFQIKEHKLCQNNENQQFQLQLFCKSNLNIQLCSTTLTLARLQTGIDYSLKLNGKTKAKLCFTKLQRTKDRTFLDYLQSGLQIQTAIAIDFTSSNGHYQNSESRHYLAEGKASQYETVMKNLLGVMLEYNENRSACVLGFGAAVKHPDYDTQGKVSHCFPLNMKKQNPYLHKKQQIIEAYRASLPYLQFSSPTLLVPLLNWAKQEALKSKQNSQKNEYLILFILADGQFHDHKESNTLLAEFSNLPFSLVIIGIGDENFQLMDELNSDALMDNRKGRKLVKFVQYNKYKDKLRTLIDEVVLCQIPGQVEEYFKIREQEEMKEKQRLKKSQKSSVVSSLTKKML